MQSSSGRGGEAERQQEQGRTPDHIDGTIATAPSAPPAAVVDMLEYIIDLLLEMRQMAMQSGQHKVAEILADAHQGVFEAVRQDGKTR